MHTRSIPEQEMIWSCLRSASRNSKRGEELGGAAFLISSTTDEPSCALRPMMKTFAPA